MPEGENTPGQEPTNNTPSTESGSRSIDSFPAEAQDYIRRLRAENAEHRTGLKSVQAKLKEFEDRDKSETQKLAERAENAERAVQASSTQLLRYEVAAEKGIPLSLAGRLQGSSKAELEADADKLKKDFGLADDGGSSAGGSGFDGGPRRPVQRPKTMNGVIRQAVGR